MRQPACQSLLMQDAYPSQAEGGLEGGVCGVLKRALKAWDQKRWDGRQEFRYGAASNLYRRAKPTPRAEVTWNAKPKPAGAATIKVPRATKSADDDKKQQLLARRRELYRETHGPQKIRKTLDLEKRRQSVKRAVAAFRARQKAKTK